MPTAASNEALYDAFVTYKGFARTMLKMEPWDKQDAIMDALELYPRVAVKACNSSGKCVASSETITLSDGRRMIARDLVGHSFTLLTRSDDGIVPVVARAEWNGIEPVFELETESGRRVRRNGAHPFWAADAEFPAGNRPRVWPRGWTPLKELRPGMLVGAPVDLPAFGMSQLPEAEIILLALMIGDGGMTTRAVTFSQQDGPVLEEFRVACAAVGARMLSAHRPVDYRVIGDGSRKSGSNPVLNLLDRHGLTRVHSRDKHIPEAIWSLSREQLALFLSRLYGTDGWASVASTGTVEIGFCSASERMIRELQDLLLRFGIVGKIVAKPKVRAWVLAINAAEDVVAFCDRIGIFGKEDAVRRVRAVAGQRQRRTQWKSLHAPAQIRWERVRSVSPVGSEVTVAIEVPGAQTFLTGLWEHNTYVAGAVTLAHMSRYPDAIVLTTAPTDTQVRQLLWRYIHEHRIRSGMTFGKANETELYVDPKNLRRSFALGYATDQAERFQGYHSGHILVIIDEGPGVPEFIWKAVDGIRAGGKVRVLTLGNPTIIGGRYHRCFARNSPWHQITITAFDTPNLRLRPSDLEYLELGRDRVGSPLSIDELLSLPVEDGGPLDDNVIPELTTRRWVREMYEEVGPDDPEWQGRVMAQFPDQAEGALFSMASLELARQQGKAYGGEIIGSDRLAVGIDVGGGGKDRTALAVFRGDVLLELKDWSKRDASGDVVKALEPYKHEIQARGSGTTIRVDTIGVGLYLVPVLETAGYTNRVHGVMFSNAPDTYAAPWRDEERLALKKRYLNLRAKAYFDLRDLMAQGRVVGFRLTEAAIHELLQIKYHEIELSGKLAIESKKEMEARGVSSPNLADAIALARLKVTRDTAPGAIVMGTVRLRRPGIA
jgi:intein/homing endonuclease